VSKQSAQDRYVANIAVVSCLNRLASLGNRNAGPDVELMTCGSRNATLSTDRATESLLSLYETKHTTIGNCAMDKTVTAAAVDVG